ncbi:MAG: ECF RNA polymerase sigma factor SigE [Pelotomaculum sp. PtaB.Bin104]|nr:MAG: ECF RNA polymerase sigma factor SigE [Pelotomaculum sp. PtaB.Bin104]
MDKNITTIWHELSVPLKNFIKKRVPNEQDTEDILQEIFSKIHSRIDGLQDDNKIHAWIYKMTRNAIMDYYRKKEKAIELSELAEKLTNETEEDLSANGEIAMCLRAMVDQLPEKYKQAIILTEFHNLTQKEMGEKLGLSLSGAKSRVQRGRAMLKEILLGCCHLEFDRMGNIIDYKHKTKDCKFC